MNTLKYYFLLVVIILISTVNSKSENTDSLHLFNLKKHIQFLASDSLEGRQPATPGNYWAADYIESEFKSLGLKPIGGVYRHSLNYLGGIEMGEGNSAIFDLLLPRPYVPKTKWRRVKKTWKVNSDWMPYNFSETGTVSGQLVFGGYGISAPELNYDDYSGIDVKGSVVIMLDHTPDGTEQIGKSKFSRKSYRDFSKYSDLSYKTKNALDHGAVGVIIVRIQGDSANVFTELKPLRTQSTAGLVCIQGNRTSISKFFTGKKTFLPLEKEINSSKKPNSFLIENTNVSITVNMGDKQIKVPNVFGMLSGTDSDLANNYLVVGAHFDHIGWGDEHSMFKEVKVVFDRKIKKIHNGADDNASGIAGMIELAKMIKQNPLNRPVIFVALNAEEFGLIGSKYFVDNPPVPIEQIDYFLNFDMIGRMKNSSLYVFGAKSSLEVSDIIDKMNEEDTLMNLKSAMAMYAPSDIASFYTKNIPAIMLNTGVHNDFHQPTDDWQKIKFKGMLRVLDFSHNLLKEIDKNDEKPQFQDPGIKLNDITKTESSSGGRPWFGIIPNFEKNPNGFKISGTSGGSPAQRAGLRDGDVITKFGDFEIRSLVDLTKALNKHKPQDKVKVKFLRKEKSKTASVTLQKR